MKKRQMQKWILALAAMILVCFVFYKADFFHAEDANPLENETLDFLDEEDEGEENESEENESEENESEENGSEEYEEDTEEIPESPDDESQDDESNLSVASVTDENGDIKFYNSISDAWEAAKSRSSATVTLMEDKNLEECDDKHHCLYVEDNDNITLELADNVTLSGKSGDGVICVEGGVFILNGGNGSVINKYDPVGAILVKNGEFTLKSGNVVGEGDIDKQEFGGNLSCGMQIQGGTIYIEDGEIKGSGKGTGAKVKGKYIVGLYVQGGIVNINGGYITGEFEGEKHGVGIYATENINDKKNSIVNISGGKIEGIGEGKDVSGYGVCMDKDSVTVNISGGIIIGKSNNDFGKGIYVTGGVANISGGTIAGYSESENRIGSGVDVSEESKAFIYGGVIIGSGRYKSYGVSVSDSGSCAEIKGGIIIGNDSITSMGVNVDKGGHVIISGGDVTGIGGNSGYGVYVYAANAEIKGGIITGTSNANSYGVSVRSGGTVDIKNGEITGSCNNINNGEGTGNSNSSSYGVNVIEEGVVNINGGFIGKNNTYTYHYVDYDDSNKITVKEGRCTDAKCAYGVNVSSGVVNINTGEINGSGTEYGCGVHVSDDGNAFVIGGNITGTGNLADGYGIKVDGGTAKIRGGVFTGEGGSENGYGMEVEGGKVNVIHGTSTPYGGMFIGNGNKNKDGYGLYVKDGNVDVTLCTGVYKGSTHSVYTSNYDIPKSFTSLHKQDHAYRYVNIPADEANSITEEDSTAVPDSIVINRNWIYDDNNRKLSKEDFDGRPVTVMKIPLKIKELTVEPTEVEYDYSDKEAPVICIEANRLIRDDKEITYQWYEDGKSILGATEKTYVPVGLSIGKHSFKCEVICDQYESTSDEVEIEVKAKLITATVTIKDKEYDGSAKADIDNIILNEDFVDNDNVYLAYDGNPITDYSEIKALFDAADVGTQRTLKSEDMDKFGLIGEDEWKYLLKIDVKPAKIKSRELKLTVSVNDKVYDGSCYVDIDKTTFLIDGSIAAGDSIALAIKEIVDDKDYILKFSDKNVNEDIPIDLKKEYIQLTNNEKGNYSLIYPDDITADITPVEVGLTVEVKDEEIGADEMKKSDNSATIIDVDFDREKLAACDKGIVDLVDFSNIKATFESVELGKHTIKFDSDFYLIDSNGERTNNYILIPNVMAAIYKKDASGTENPAPENPAPENPVPENPVPENPAPENPVPENPAPENPVPENPAPENPVPEDNSTSTFTEEPIKINSILSGLDKNPFTGINDHLLYFTVVFVLFGGIILIIYFTGKRKKGKSNSKS